MPRTVRLDSCASTSSALAAMPDAPHGTLLVTDRQEKGRGQRGNSWEAAPGRNLTFSLLLRPSLPAARQFELSMLVSLAIADFLAGFIDGKRVKIKWPNDIYVDDGKICGILIENALAGNKILRSIAGVGININQARFESDAPNPVSLIHFTGKELPLEPLLDKAGAMIVDYVDSYCAAPDPAALKGRYMAALYRHDGRRHTFRRPDGSTFDAEITDVGIDGMLRLSDGMSYAFKEIAYVI